ncbi:hypothetical protein [Pseudobutyrivibrio sp.]|uniref:hypothetical protein n=1 Tax=Pseudobutyrivibrio sp. TaxID=2014367 RepID=UPI0025DB8B7E|nr:hypothetical protein [Pseudobutyrivibrio sp.]
MRLQIPYNEFEQLLSEYFQQKMIRQIKLAYVDESTIQVSAVVKIKLKVMEATVPVKENVSVKKVDGSDVTLTHQTGMAIGLKWEQVLELCEDVVKDMLEVQDNNTLLVHLDKIDKLNTILEKVEMQSISFEPDYINLCFVLK